VPTPTTLRTRLRNALAPLLAATLAATLAAGLAACQPTEDTQTDDTVQIVASTGMLADAANAIAGEHATVYALMGPGIDPHLYAPTRDDAQRMLDADTIIYNGHLLEGRLTDSIQRARDAGKPVLAAVETLPTSRLLAADEEDKQFDPHVWMDPAIWIDVVQTVRDHLINTDPDHADAYAANADAYLARLRELDEYAQQVLATVPENQRILITAHDAFNYFGERYGFQVRGIQGLSTESEAGVQDIENLVDLIVDNNVAAIFVESTVSDSNINALISGARARGHTVTIGGELYSDAMGNPGTYEGTYIGMIDHNATLIAQALGGQAPPAGMQGKLAAQTE